MRDDYTRLITKMVHYISKDEKSPTSRQELSNYLGICDRHCRHLREIAFEQGIPIITSSNFSGAFISYSPEHINMVKRESMSRAMKELTKAHAASRMLENIGQQKINLSI